jgi:putative membrane protein
LPEATGGARSHRQAIVLMTLFLIEFVALGIAPASRTDWLLENAITVLALAWAVWWQRRVGFSRWACSLLFAFAAMHEIGAHYQYSDVPYEQWFASISNGFSIDALFGFERNQFDRLVHFLYGLLITPVAAEVITARVRLRGFWLFVLPVTFMMSHALIYELIEWAAAGLFAEEVGQAYLGTQGDVWDAQKDMLLATLGSLIAQPLWMWRRARRACPDCDWIDDSGPSFTPR